MNLPDLHLSGPLPPIAHLDQWGGVWAIEERHARQLLSSLGKLNLSLHMAAHQAEVAEKALAADFRTVETGGERVIAVIEIAGTMTKYGSSMSSQGSTLRARRELRKATGDNRVTGILLKLDSPGGSVSGTPDLAREVAEAAKQKPVYAYAEDCCCSAAYYVASQATKVFANENAIVGSIGVYFVVNDFSKLYEAEGVDTHIVKFGEHKGDGVEGLPITEGMLAEWQSEVDVLGEQFVAAVAKGRGMSKSAAGKLADGRVWIGKAAIDAKLIDGIQSLDATLAQLAKAKPASSGRQKAAADDPLYALSPEPVESPESSVQCPEPDTLNSQHSTLHHTEGTEMAKNPMTAPEAADTPQPATYSEIAAGCKGFDKNSGDDAKFAASCWARNLTLAQCKDEWNETLAARLEAREQELAAAKEQAAKAAPAAKPAGNPPLNDGDGAGSKGAGSTGDVIAQWSALVKSHQEAGLSKASATRKAAIENQELHAAYLSAYDREMRAGRLPAQR